MEQTEHNNFSSNDEKNKQIGDLVKRLQATAQELNDLRNEKNSW